MTRDHDRREVAGLIPERELICELIGILFLNLSWKARREARRMMSAEQVEALRRALGGDPNWNDEDSCPWCGAPVGGCDCVERVTCTRAGELGHALCGLCAECKAPRFRCPLHEGRSSL